MTTDSLGSQTPGQRMSRSDVHFPLTTPRKRNPSVPVLTHAATDDGQSSGQLRLRLAAQAYPANAESDDQKHAAGSGESTPKPTQESQDEIAETPETPEISNEPLRTTNIQDLPEELQKRILDYIFGDLRPVNAASTSTSLSHRMRHPRRKAVSELALISPHMRILVQERIYRHIKIKGTKAGLRESQDWFGENSHLAAYVRHIEYWVPVWGDKAAQLNTISQQQQQLQAHNAPGGFVNELAYGGDAAGHDFPGIQFKLSTYSATLAQIFDHLSGLFPIASIFTLEGGHCKNSNIIKHFSSNLFNSYLNNHLRVLPNIKVFAMRGAWNIMRSYEDWNTISQALPCLTEWHCGYARPRNEAYATVNEILLQLPNGLRHVDVSMDSMFSKDDTVLGSTPSERRTCHHICEQLGRISTKLESLSYTGRVCECFWTAVLEALEQDAKKGRPCMLKSVEMVVKSCCRQRIKSRDTVTGDILVEEIGGIMADGAGIGNLVFINAFERLVIGALDALAAIPSLQHIKIRYIDLDSPCQQLNPYWTVENNTVTGIWNSRIVERLSEARPGLHYERLEDGIGGDDVGRKKEEDDAFQDWSRGAGLVGHGIGNASQPSGANALYPRTIPRGINTGSYRVLSEARAA